MRLSKILLVDDDANILEAISTVLSKYDFEIKSAADGREARQLLGVENFDLMITDLVMPDFDGLALIALSRLSTPA